jgi:hypothetical protein
MSRHSSEPNQADSSEPNQADLGDKPIGVASVDRILAAVGLHPSDLDRAQLAKRLGEIRALYHAAQSLRSKPAKRRKDAERLCEDLLKMKERVEKHMASRARLMFSPPWEHSFAFDRAIADIAEDIEDEELMHRIAVARNPDPTAPYAPPYRHRARTVIAKSSLSETEYLIFLLSKAFELFFDKDNAGYSTNPITGAKYGPFLRFAEAAIAELGIERIKPERISRAVATIRKLGKNQTSRA